MRAPERGLQPPFINLTSPKQEQRLATYDAMKLDAEIRRDASLRLQSLSEKWPETFDRAEVSFIENPNTKASSAVEFKSNLELEETPSNAIARFIGSSAIELWVNGNLIGKTFNRNQGAAADLLASSRPEPTILLIAASPTELGLVLIMPNDDQKPYDQPGMGYPIEIR